MLVIKITTISTAHVFQGSIKNDRINDKTAGHGHQTSTERAQ